MRRTRHRPTIFARWTFSVAAIYGFSVLTPLYFLENEVARDQAGLAQPHFYYGFIGTALAAQVMFAIIARDPARFRPLMVAAVVEKLGFGVPAWWLWAAGRIGIDVAMIGGLDLIWAALFARAYIRLAPVEHDRQ